MQQWYLLLVVPHSIILDAIYPYITIPSKIFFPSFIIRDLPPGKIMDMHIVDTGFKCSGCEPGLGYCNPTKPNCPSVDHALILKCAKPDPALTNAG